MLQRFYIQFLSRSSVHYMLMAMVALLSFLLSSVYEQPLLLLLPMSIIGMVAMVMDFRILFYALMVALPISVEYMVTSSIGTDLPSEPLMIVCTLASVLYFVWDTRRLDLAFLKHPIFVILLVSLMWTGVTVIFSSHVLPSLKFFLAKLWYVIPFCILFYHIVKQKGELRTLLWLLILPMFLIVVKALIQHAAMGFAFENVNRTMQPFFRNHVNYAVMIVILIPYAYYMREQYLPKSIRRWVWNTVIVVFLLGLYFSYTRAAILALFVAMAAVLIMRRGGLTITLLSVAALCTLVVSYLTEGNRYLRYAPQYEKTVYHDALLDHIESTFRLEDVSSAERVYRWLAGIKMSVVHPITGWGPNTFAKHYKHYTVTEFTTWVSDNEDNSTVHDYPLLVLIEQGFVGLAIFVFMILYVLYFAQSLMRRVESPQQRLLLNCAVFALVALLFNLLLADLMEVDKNGTVFFMSIAIIIGVDIATKEKSKTIE